MAGALYAGALTFLLHPVVAGIDSASLIELFGSKCFFAYPAAQRQRRYRWGNRCVFEPDILACASLYRSSNLGKNWYQIYCRSSIHLPLFQRSSTLGLGHELRYAQRLIAMLSSPLTV